MDRARPRSAFRDSSLRPGAAPVPRTGPVVRWPPPDGGNPSGDPTGDAGPTLSWRPLDAGAWATTTSLQTLVARNAAGYAALRALANTTNAPAVDFETEKVVGTFLDTRPAGS